MLKRENYHIKMCFLFLVWQQCASVKKRNRPTDQPASNPTPLTGVGAKPRCRWRASPDWARSLTQEEALRNCLFFFSVAVSKTVWVINTSSSRTPLPTPTPSFLPRRLSQPLCASSATRSCWASFHLPSRAADAESLFHWHKKKEKKKHAH